MYTIQANPSGTRSIEVYREGARQAGNRRTGAGLTESRFRPAATEL